MNYLKTTADRLPLVPFTIKIYNNDGAVFGGRMFTVTKKSMDPISGECMVKVVGHDISLNIAWDDKKMQAASTHSYYPN